MRIVFIQKSAGTGGAKNSLLETLRCLRDQPDMQCCIVTGERGRLTEQCQALGMEPLIGKLPEWRKFFDRLFFRKHLNVLAGQLRSFAPDYVISNETWWAPHAQYLATQLACRSACIVRDTLAAGDKARQYQLPELDRVWCISAAMQNELRAAAGLSANLRLVYNAVFPPVINPAKDSELDALLGKFPRARQWLLVAGRVGDRKNQIEAVRALAHLQQSGRGDFGLLLAGEIDADYLPRLQAGIEQTGLGEFVCLPGQVDAIGNMIQRCKATLLTSRREGLPRSIIESFLLGKPSFSTPLSGLDEIYGDHRQMFVSREADGEALAQTILSALANPGLLETATVAVRERVAAAHAPENHLRQLRAALA